MRVIFMALCSTLIFANALYAEKHTYLFKEDLVLLEEGDSSVPYSPCSTFKIPLSLIGLDAGILKDAKTPQWKFKEKYLDGFTFILDRWRQDHNPSMWLKNSCVWYSQKLTKKLGEESFQFYVSRLNYGNEDLSGDQEKNNGLTHCWLSSSLKISVSDQVNFLEDLYNEGLALSDFSQKVTKEMLFLEPLNEEWDLYGKTGGGHLLDEDGYHEMGWFVGWAQNKNRHIIFAYHIKDEEKQLSYPSIRAKEAVKACLLDLIH